MITVITCGKTIARFGSTPTEYLAAHHQAFTLSQQNPDVPVYVQDGATRTVYRNGRSL